MQEFQNEIIKDEIIEGLSQVDESLVIDEFACQFDSLSRTLTVKMTISNEAKEAVEINLDY